MFLNSESMCCVKKIGGGWVSQKSYVIVRVGHGKCLRSITRWVGGVKKGQKHAYVIFEWSLIMTIVPNFKSFTSFQQAFFGKKKVRVIFWINQQIFAKILQPSLQVGCLIRQNVGVCTCKENESGGNRHSFYDGTVSLN